MSFWELYLAVPIEIKVAYFVCLFFSGVKFGIILSNDSFKACFKILVLKLFSLIGWSLIHYSFVELFDDISYAAVHWFSMIPISLYILRQFLDIGKKLEENAKSKNYLIRILEKMFDILEKGFFEKLENYVFKVGKENVGKDE